MKRWIALMLLGVAVGAVWRAVGSDAPAGGGSADSPPVIVVAEEELAPEPPAVDVPAAAPGPRTAQTPKAIGRHVLIGYADSDLGSICPRSREEAESLAREIFERARDGHDMLELVATYSDDPNKTVDSGLRRIRNFGATAASTGVVESPRARLPAYGDVLFALDVGEVGLVAPDPRRNRLGYFVVKRIE